MYSVAEDCKLTLTDEIEDLFEREANNFATEVLFQLDSFTEQAADDAFGLARDMINVTNMAQLLRVFRSHRWPPSLPFRLFQSQYGRVLDSSPPCEIPGPVEPHSGPLVPLADRWRREYKYLWLPGAENASEEGHSRALAEVPELAGLYFWTDTGHRFETNPQHRGFSCVGYVAAVCGVRSATFWGGLAKLDGVKGVTSADILQYLGTEGVQVRLSQRPASEVAAFFAGGRPGYFIVWRQGQHTTMVTGQTVHEFVGGGYRQSPLAQRVRRPADGWSVAELRARPALAD